MTDDELVTVLGESIIAAARSLREGKPQAALDMVDIILMAVPAQGLEVVELASLPTKILALGRLGRIAEARQVLVRMEHLAATHGSTDDLRACKLLREQIVQPDLTARASAATEAIKAGKPEGVAVLEAIVVEASRSDQPVIALGALVFLGKVYAAVERPDDARERLNRAKQLLEGARPLDDDRHAIAAAEIDKLLATLAN